MIKFLNIKEGKSVFENDYNISNLPSSSKRKYFDIKGSLSLALSITFILLDLSYLQIFEGSGLFLAFFSLSIVSIIAFIQFEKKANVPSDRFKVYFEW